MEFETYPEILPSPSRCSWVELATSFLESSSQLPWYIQWIMLFNSRSALVSVSKWGLNYTLHFFLSLYLCYNNSTVDVSTLTIDLWYLNTVLPPCKYANIRALYSWNTEVMCLIWTSTASCSSVHTWSVYTTSNEVCAYQSQILVVCLENFLSEKMVELCTACCEMLLHILCTV